MTHPHQSCDRGVCGGVLADLRRPAADVQTSAGVTRERSYLSEESGHHERATHTWVGRRLGDVTYLPGHQLERILLKGLHLVEP